jgi:hypothetical protein
LPLAAFKRVPLRNPPSFFVQKNSAFFTRALNALRAHR